MNDAERDPFCPREVPQRGGVARIRGLDALGVAQASEPDGPAQSLLEQL